MACTNSRCSFGKIPVNQGEALAPCPDCCRATPVTVKYVVGKYGEQSTSEINSGVLCQSPGYPVFRIFSDKPEIKHVECWFVYEDNARTWAKIKNSDFEKGRA